MKLSRILLSVVAVATVAACGNLSKVTEAGTQNIKKLMVRKYHNWYGQKLISQLLIMTVVNLVHGQIGIMFE